MRNIVPRSTSTLPVLLAAIALTFAVGCPWLTVPPTDGTATGACCAGDGTCTEVTEADCTTAGGTYQGDGTSCTPNPCEAAPDGATLYADNCAACHGATGSEGFAPDITGKTAAELTTGLGSATHGAITLTADEIAAIATFLGG